MQLLELSHATRSLGPFRLKRKYMYLWRQLKMIQLAQDLMGLLQFDSLPHCQVRPSADLRQSRQTQFDLLKADTKIIDS